MELKERVSIGNGLWIADWEYNLRILMVFVAIEILLAYSPFGFIVFSTISFSTLFVGIMVAALWGGPIAGAIIGMVYGLCSMWKASVTAVNPMDLMFSPLKSGNPIGSWLLALGPRMLFGVLAGLLYFVLLRCLPEKGKLPGILMASIVLERVQSALTYLFIDKVFHVEGVSAAKSLEGLFRTNRLVIWLMVLVLMFLAYGFFKYYISRKYYREFYDIREAGLNKGSRYHLMMSISIVIVGLIAMHLWDRIKIIIFEIDKCPPRNVSDDLLAQVLIQFLVAAISAIYILFVLYRHARNKAEIARSKTAVQLDLEKAHSKELEIRAMRDALTGAFNRKGFARIAKEDAIANHPIGFLLVDIDNFKEINDTYGHEIGDKILMEITHHLRDAFGDHRVFRFGGDEFAVLLSGDEDWNEENMKETWEDIIRKYHRMYEHLADILERKLFVTLSVGACFSDTGYHENLYPLADLALYETKNHGRAGCTLVDETGKILASWRDEAAAGESQRGPQHDHAAVGRLEYSQDGKFTTRFICNEAARGIFGFAKEETPEECFRIWKAGVEAEYLDGVDIADKALYEMGFSEFTYVWNHPLKGRMLIRSGGVGELRDGVMTVLSYHVVEEELGKA